jgi:hypothetical protein
MNEPQTTVIIGGTSGIGLDNRAVNGVNLNVDGGWLLT